MEIPSSDVVKKAQSSDDPSLAHLRHRDEEKRQAISGITPESNTPWSVIAVSIVAALGLVWLCRRRRSQV